MEEQQKSYYAIIPANVRYDNNLPANAKLLYGEITALCNEKGYCWASNDYFAKLYGVSKTSVSKWITSLIDGGYLFREIIYKDGTKEILNRYLRIVKYPIEEKLNTPIEEKLKDNNTSINNTINNTLDINTAKAEQDNIPYKDIILYLNYKINANYKDTTRKTRDLIKARFNEGFTTEDFKVVIDKKSREWLKDKKMSKFLRPETLFGTKFENYLNQKEERPSIRDLDIDISDLLEM